MPHLKRFYGTYMSVVEKETKLLKRCWSVEKQLRRGHEQRIKCRASTSAAEQQQSRGLPTLCRVANSAESANSAH